MNTNTDRRAVATRDRSFVRALGCAALCVPPLRSLPQASQVGNLLEYARKLLYIA